MDFSDETILQAWKRADGKCECERTSHNHSGRCGKELVWENHGREGSGAWEAHHINSEGGEELSNCEILCWEPCHRLTL